MSRFRGDLIFYYLCRELWCQSVNTGSWWKIVKRYSTSLAVMSVIGYIIGLGDRHLDNVLVHLSTGEVYIPVLIRCRLSANRL